MAELPMIADLGTVETMLNDATDMLTQRQAAHIEEIKRLRAEVAYWVATKTYLDSIM